MENKDIKTEFILSPWKLSGLKGLTKGLREIIRETELRAYALGYKAGLEESDREEPKPCDGPLYNHWDTGDFLVQIHEEVTESIKAYNEYSRYPSDGSRKDFGRELTDIITAATSTMERAGFTLEERRELQKEVNASNAKRDGGRRFKK